jgi:DegV family protein with EDD domain
MKHEVIDGKKLYSYIVSGARNLIVNEHNLNSINVFPVADGDTGTNLALTMKTVLNKAKQLDRADLTMDGIAKIAVENAYGNSGMIFAQYLNGLANGLKDKESVTEEEFIQVFDHAVSYAYQAVAAPKEGTILTVMSQWANDLKLNIGSEFEELFEKSVNSAKLAVDSTKFKLKVLLDNNVVDAGAKGFLFFVEGILHFIKTGKMDDVEFQAAELDDVSQLHPNTDLGDNRYCSQYMIQTDKSTDFFKMLLKDDGDSLVVTNKDEYVQVHIHTNDPAKVMTNLVKAGTVTTHKVDDMQLQTNMLFKPISKIGIITDSIADLPKEIMDKYQITVIPLNLIVESTVYSDKVTMTPEYFYEYLDKFKMNPTSAQATPDVIERIVNGVLKNVDSVIGIFVSSKMSGTFNNISRVINKMEIKDKKIALIDSKVNSVAQGMLVKEAALLREEGLSFDEIVTKIEQKVAKTHIYVSVKDLKYMIRGGRVSKVQGIILSKLKLKPVISIDEKGNGTIFAKTLSVKSAEKAILKKIKKDMKEFTIEKYSMVYADDSSVMDRFVSKVEKIIGKKPEYVDSISPIVGLNAGNGAFAIGYIKS